MTYTCLLQVKGIYNRILIKERMIILFLQVVLILIILLLYQMIPIFFVFLLFRKVFQPPYQKRLLVSVILLLQLVVVLKSLSLIKIMGRLLIIILRNYCFLHQKKQSMIKRIEFRLQNCLIKDCVKILRGILQSVRLR